MAAVKKVRRTGRKFHGRKAASKWQSLGTTIRPRRVMKKKGKSFLAQWEPIIKSALRTQSPKRTFHGDVEPATDCRRQQELESSRLSRDLDTLLGASNPTDLARGIGDVIKRFRRKPSKKTEPRIRPVSPKLFKMSDGVTQSLMHGFLACRRLLQLVLQGWRSAVTKAAMTYGSIFHDLLEHYYIGIISGKVDRDTNFAAFAKKFTKLWIKKHSRRLRHGGDLKMAYTETAKVCAVFPAYCHFHDEDFDEIDWQELEGVFDVEWRGFRLRGRWDGLYKLHKRLWLFETKTKGRIEPTDIKRALLYDFQCLFYITALAERRRERIRGVCYNVIRNPGLKQGKTESAKRFMKRIAADAEKRNKFYFMRFEAPFGKAVRQEFETELEMKLNEMKDWLDGKLATYKNEGSCVRRFNCEFISACSSGTMAGYIGKGQLFTELL